MVFLLTHGGFFIIRSVKLVTKKITLYTDNYNLI